MTREKSVSCASLGSAFRLDITNWTCSQFCIVNASAWSTTSTSMLDRKSALLHRSRQLLQYETKRLPSKRTHFSLPMERRRPSGLATTMSLA